MSASTQLAYRTQKAIGVLNAAPLYEPLPGLQRLEGTTRCCGYSPDGRWFGLATPENVKIIDASSGATQATLEVQNVHDIAFSPKGSYIQTWERPGKQEDGNATKNLKVWSTATSKEVASFVQKSQGGWNLQYTYDEKYCARVVTNTVQFFESDKMNTVWNHLRVEGVTEFTLSPGKNYSIAVFVPERKGQPAIVRTYMLPDFVNRTSQKTFFKADKVQMKWNALGTAVLVLTQTEVDKTGKSYYGETNLFLMSATGNYDCRVALDKEGPIHDVSWSPNSREFGVVYGYMPAKTTIYDIRANVLHSLPLGPRNTILFSPHARFVVVAGFGNLQGAMDIYDCEKNMTKVATIEASNASVCEWSPDGQHILTATTSPRLRVDNGIKVWHYSGALMYLEELTELYNVYWRPEPPTAWPLPNPMPSAPAPHPSAAQYIVNHAPVKPAGAYRPPHARGSATPLHFKREDEGGAAHVYTNGSSNNGNGVNGFGSRRREVPGAAPAEKPVPGAAPGGGVSLAGTGDAPLTKTALKNKKKREAAKKAKEAAAAAAAAATTTDGSSGQEGSTPSQQQPNSNETSVKLTVDGKPIPTGPSSERQGREGGERRREHRSRSRHNRDSPHRGPQGQGQPHRRSKSRNHESRERDQSRNGNGHHHGHHHKHSRGQSGDSKNHVNGGGGGGGSRDLTLNLNASGIGFTVPTGAHGPLSPVPGTPSTNEDKKLRGLHKKLRAIEDLKMRLAAGEKLEDTQMKKIATEEQVRRELGLLGGV